MSETTVPTLTDEHRDRAWISRFGDRWEWRDGDWCTKHYDRWITRAEVGGDGGPFTVEPDHEAAT